MVIVLIVFTGRQVCREHDDDDIEVTVEVPGCSNRLPMLSTGEEMKVRLHTEAAVVFTQYVSIDAHLSPSPARYDA